MTSRQANIVRLLAHSTLLPNYVSEPILDGNPPPPLQQIVEDLLVHAVDCLVTLTNDPTATLNEVRMVRASVAAAFLAALAITSLPDGT